MAIIPARYGSSRLPGKPLADIGGRPMIEHVYRRAASAPSVDRVIVATDDTRIVEAVERFGGEARLTRPDHASGSDRLAEVARDLTCDVVVNVQGDEPLLDARMIEEAVAALRSDADVPMATLRRRIVDERERRDPNVVKVVVDRQDFALYFSRTAIPHVRGGSMPSAAIVSAAGGSATARRVAGRAATAGQEPIEDECGASYKHVGLYVYRRAFLLLFTTLDRTPLEQAESLEQLRALEHGFRIKAVETTYDSIGVDTEEDLRRVRQCVETEGRA